MGLLTSLIGLAAVLAAGWFTIYYLVPRLEGVTTTTTTPATAADVGKEPASDDITKVLEEITGAIKGEVPPTAAKKEEKPVAKKEMRFIESWAY
jgi:hypothetical protein